MKVFIPFEGFYNSYLGSMVDDLVVDQDTGEELGMSMSLDAIARVYAQTYSSLLSVGDSYGKGIGFDADLTFIILYSPVEYNHSTDRILCDIPESTVKAICHAVTFATLDKVIKDRHSSRDGFVSFYSDSIGDWINQGALNFDENQLETLMIAYMIDAGFSEDWQLDIAYHIQPLIF